MRVAMILLGLLVMVLLAGAVPIAGHDVTQVFRTPATIALLIVLALLLVGASLRRRAPLRWAAFALCHLAMVVILVGALLGFLFAVRREVTVPANGTTIEALPSPCKQDDLREFIENVVPILDQRFDLDLDPSRLVERFSECPHTPAQQRAVPLGFTLAASDFTVSYHDPTYALLRRDGEETVHVRDVRPRGRSLSLGAAGSVRVGRLRQGGGWVEEYRIDDTWFLHRHPSAPREFRAVLRFDDGAAHPIRVNHPVSYEGWRFYLSSYSLALPGLPPQHPGQGWMVTLIARADPGRGWAIAGLWMLMVGTAMLCLAPRRTRTGDAT